MKRKWEEFGSPEGFTYCGTHRLVSAVLLGDTAKLRAELASATPAVVRGAVLGCRPVDAAVIANSAEAVRLLAPHVDLDEEKEEFLDDPRFRAEFAGLLPTLRPLGFAFSTGSTALHAALCLRRHDAAVALLEAGASASKADGDGGTALVAFDQGFDWVLSREDGGAAHQAMLRRLLDAGADPLAPAAVPFIAQCTRESAKPCLDWMLAAHASGRHPLTPTALAVALQAAIRHQHSEAYRQLLPLAQQQREALPAGTPLRLLFFAANHGTPDMVPECLNLGADPASAEAAAVFLLAQAAMQSRISRGEAMLAALLAVKAKLGVQDLLRAVVVGDVYALRRLLKLGRPQADPAVPYVRMLDRVGGLDHYSNQLSCPVLANLELAATMHGHLPSTVPADIPFLMRDFCKRLDMMEALRDAGYRPMRYRGVDEEGPWQWDPLTAEQAPQRFAATGRNRMLMVALEQPRVGSSSFQRLPRRLKAAVREVLLIAHHGLMVPMESLTPEQLAAVCCYQRQQLYQQLDAEEAEQQRQRQRQQQQVFGGSTLAYTTSRYRFPDTKLRLWARERGWVPRQERQGPAGGAGAGGSSSRGLPLDASLREARGTVALLAGMANFVPGLPMAVQQLASAVDSNESMARAMAEAAQQRAAEEADNRLLQDACQLTSWQHEHGIHGGGRGERSSGAASLHRLQELERRLDQQLMAGAMQRPSLPTSPHPLRRLPRELLIHILQLAACPLSAWVQPEDFGVRPRHGGGSRAGADSDSDSRQGRGRPYYSGSGDVGLDAGAEMHGSEGDGGSSDEGDDSASVGDGGGGEDDAAAADSGASGG